MIAPTPKKRAPPERGQDRENSRNAIEAAYL
jgi:hypothetical protein